MNRFLPKSLFGQTLLVLVAGLIVSLLVGSWIYTLDREQAVRAVLAAGLRTADIWAEGTKKVGTRAMGDAVVAALAGKPAITTKH